MRTYWLPVVAVSTVAVASVATMAAPPVALRVAATWRSGDGTKQVIVDGLPAGAFIAKRNALANQGLAISQIAVYHANDAENYVAVFEPVPDSKSVTHLLSATWDQFAAKDKEQFDQGLRVVDVALSMDPQDARKVRYTGVWRGGLGTGAQWTDAARSWTDFLSLAKERFDKGLRPVSMSAISVLDNVQSGSRKPLFTATWRNNLGTGALYFVGPAEGPAYTPALVNHFNNGLRTVAFNAYTLNGKTPIYVGAVRNGLGTPGEWNSPALTWADFIAEHQKRVASGYRLVDISVYTQFTLID